MNTPKNTELTDELVHQSTYHFEVSHGFEGLTAVVDLQAQTVSDPSLRGSFLDTLRISIKGSPSAWSVRVQSTGAHEFQATDDSALCEQPAELEISIYDDVARVVLATALEKAARALRDARPTFATA